MMSMFEASIRPILAIPHCRCGSATVFLPQITNILNAGGHQVFFNLSGSSAIGDVFVCIRASVTGLLSGEFGKWALT